VKENPMDMRNGDIYDNFKEARKAGVPDEFLVQGSKEALENLKKQLHFSKGSFKNVKPPDTRDEVTRFKAIGEPDLEAELEPVGK
jgi:hypothetical protein